MTAGCVLSRTTAALISALVDVTPPQTGPVLMRNADGMVPLNDVADMAYALGLGDRLGGARRRHEQRQHPDGARDRKNSIHRLHRHHGLLPE